MRIVILLIFLASCCPKITEETRTITKRDTVITYRTDTVLVPGSVDTVEITSTDICDSLFQELEIRNSGSTLTISKEDDKLNFVIACDSLQAVIDSIKELHVSDTIMITKTNTVTKYKKRKGKWWMWLLIGIGGGLVFAIMIRR